MLKLTTVDLTQNDKPTCAETKLHVLTSMLDLLAVGPKFTRPACHVQPTMRIARRCAALLLDYHGQRRTRYRLSSVNCR